MKAMQLMLLLSAIFPCSGAYATASEDPLQGLDFLLGKWRAVSPVQGGEVFRRELNGRVIVRTARADTGTGSKAVPMKMAMTIYSEPGTGLVAIYFDNDGHVIHYKVVELVAGISVELDSDASIPGPRFRLTYSTRGKDQLAVKFEMAPPGEQSEYTIIAEGMEKRVTH